METRYQQKTPPACLWMQAGVVKQKHCQTDFQCTTCKYDKVLRKVCQENKALMEQGKNSAGKRQNLVFWIDKLKAQPLSKRLCIHHMKGHIDFKACPKAYHCIDCEFDQYFHDQFKVYTVMQPIGYTDISGVSLPFGYYLHKGHTWLKIEDNNTVRIGMDDFASRLLGEPDEIEPLLIGKKVSQGQNVFTFFREGNKASFPSPVDGVITQVNANLMKNPKLLNQEPYTNGWVVSVYCTDLRENLKKLMFMDSATGFMTQEVKNFYAYLEEETGLMAADGGSLGSDLYGNIPGLSWEQMLNSFIHRKV